MYYDFSLLSSLWVVPLVGAAVVLLLATLAPLASFKADQPIKWASLAFTLVTFVLTLVALEQYVHPGSNASAPLRQRVANNVIDNSRPESPRIVEVEEGDRHGTYDLVCRAPWIPY